MSSSLLDQLVAVVRRYSEYALPIRLFISAFITLVAGTGLGFIAEYAAYSWAIHYGIRPPLEGIPYLRVAVTVLTVSILLGGALVYLLVRILLAVLLQWTNENLRKAHLFAKVVGEVAPNVNLAHDVAKYITWYRELGLTGVLLVSATISTLVILFFAAAIRFGFAVNFPISEIKVAVSFAVMQFVVMLLLWRARCKVWLSIGAVIVFIFGIPTALFHAEIYGNLLRLLGYGGGAHVSITVAEAPQDSLSRTEVVGYLMLRTTTALIVFERESARIREIPIQQVLFLDHGVTSLRDRPYALP